MNDDDVKVFQAGLRGGEPTPNPAQARELVCEMMVHSGLSLDEANKMLAQHGAEPFAAGTPEVAKIEKRRLLADPANAEKYLSGDAPFRAQVTALDRIIVGSDQ
jgi:hypothetical protein